MQNTLPTERADQGPQKHKLFYDKDNASQLSDNRKQGTESRQKLRVT